MRTTTISSRTLTIGASATLLLALAACGSDGTAAPGATPTGGVVVLDGFIQPGLTLLADSGSASERVVLGGPEEFDAGSFELRNDTVLAASSRGAGDQLFVADLRTQTVSRLSMAPGSNPARARLLGGGGGDVRIAVPLRDSSAVMIVSWPSGTAPAVTGTSVVRVAELGRCPVDVAEAAGALWVLDANAQCGTDYTPVGDMRLVRVPLGSDGIPSAPRDTIALPGLRGSRANIVVHNGQAYITASGDADFSSFPFTLRTEGAIARVDLATAQLEVVLPLPTGTYGGSSRLGQDGTLNVALFEDLADFASRTIVMRLPALEPTGTRVANRPWLALRDTAGALVSCSAGTTDRLGRLHCIQNRAASATFLMVFAPDGSLVREVPAGQGGVDLRLR